MASFWKAIRDLFVKATPTEPRRVGKWVDGESSAPPNVAIEQPPLLDGVRPRPLDPSAGRQRIALYCGRGGFNLVGESRYQGTLRSIANGRTEQGITVVFPAVVVPEPENPYDKNAVVVYADGFLPADGYGPIGYFAREDAKRYAPVMRELLKRNAVGTCEATLTGGWDDDASIGVKLALGGPKGVLKDLATS